MPTQLINVTGPDYWDPEYDLIWNNNRWELDVDYDDHFLLPKKVGEFWDIFDDSIIYEIQIELFSEWFNLGSCTPAHLDESVDPAVLINEGGVDVVFVSATDTSIVISPATTLLVSGLTSLSPYLTGLTYSGSCGQSYVNSIKMLVGSGAGTFWQSFSRTEEIT